LLVDHTPAPALDMHSAELMSYEDRVCEIDAETQNIL
jgi:hypothetical protein